MPERMISLLVSFFNQVEGKLSKRAKVKEFKELTAKEVLIVEKYYSQLFNSLS